MFPHFENVMRGSELEGYTPAGHTLTTNVRLLRGELTDGAFNVVRGTILDGGEAKTHFHRHSAQFMYIISGSAVVSQWTGEEMQEFVLSATDSVYFPAGFHHRVVPAAGSDLNLINVYTPALGADDIIEV